MGFEGACSEHNKYKDKQNKRQSNAKSQRFGGFFGLFLAFMFSQIKQRRSKTENYQDKGKNNDAFYNHITLSAYRKNLSYSLLFRTKCQ